MKYNIKPIQTEYKGYKFRSRLEARWAIFFDYMGIKWDYELEGYELEGGSRYLPDFKISIPIHNSDKYREHRCWVEINPEKLSKRKYEKCKLLVNGLKEDLLILVGVPDFKAYEMLSCLDSKEVYSNPICFDENKYGVYYCGYDVGETVPFFRENTTQIEAINASRQARFNCF